MDNKDLHIIKEVQDAIASLSESYTRKKIESENIIRKEKQKIEIVTADFHKELNSLLTKLNLGKTQPLKPILELPVTHQDNMNLMIDERLLFSSLSGINKQNDQFIFLAQNATKIFSLPPNGVDYAKVLFKLNNDTLEGFENKRPTLSSAISALVKAGKLIKFQVIKTKNDFRFLHADALKENSQEREIGWLENLIRVVDHEDSIILGIEEWS